MKTLRSLFYAFLLAFPAWAGADGLTSLPFGTANTWQQPQTFSSTLTYGGVTISGVTGTGNLVLSASPAITTGLTTPSTTFSLLNTTATTVNAFGGASTALNIGNASGANTVLGATAFSQAITANAGLVVGSSQAITGTVANSTISGFLSVAATTLTGTLSTAAQPNVTSLGTLTSITSSGILTINRTTGSTPFQTTIGTGGSWQVGQNAGVTGTDDNFSIYSSTWGAGHGAHALLVLDGPTAAATFAGSLTAGAITASGVLTLSGNTTGAQTASFVATNKPGTGTTGPDTWIPITLGGVVHYVPAFL